MANAFKNAIATRKEIRYFINKIYFLMAVACFNKLSFSTQTAWLFAPDKLLYRKIFMGAAQTRKPLKRLDINFKII